MPVFHNDVQNDLVDRRRNELGLAISDLTQATEGFVNTAEQANTLNLVNGKDESEHPRMSNDTEVHAYRCSEIASVLTPERVCFLGCRTKKTALTALIERLSTAGEIKDPDDLAEGIFSREELMSTGIGFGIAVPHTRLASVEKPVMCAGICCRGIEDYQSLDGLPVRLIFMIAAGQGQHSQYLKLLSRISSKLRDKKIREALMEAPDELTFYNNLTEED